MSIDIDNIFKATAQASGAFLVSNGQGLYIPAYQRPYSWSRDNVDRLFEDAVHGLNLLLKRDKTISFLGTVIAIHDTRYTTVQPIFRNEMPQRVMTIIDGQQRLCTFLMVSIAAHALATSLLKGITKQTEPHFNWLRDELEKLSADLKDCLILDMRTGDALHRFYPRIVRSYDDVWSKREGQARYQSPIARLIWDYFNHIEEDQNKTFKYDPKKSSGESDPQYSSVVTVFKAIQKQVKDLTDKKAGDADFPEMLKMIQASSFTEAIWNYQLPDDVTTYVRDHGDDAKFDRFAQGFRILVLSKYLSERMAFTVVTADSEDDAFDMFEALNTTGEPLTAFETFKPKVIEAETMARYENSPSHGYVTDIENYLMHFKKAEAKQSATSEMLVPFALAETGEKLQKRLTDQRRYLREQFEHNDLSDLGRKRDFVQRLSHMATYIRLAWTVPEGGNPDFDKAGIPSPETLVGFEMLRDLKHHITIAPMSRFFSAVLTADEDQLQTRSDDFFEAIRASIAFSTLWRAAFGGTNNIDARYRSIMSEKLQGEIPPLAVRPREGAGAVSLANYKKALRHFLTKEGIGTRADWIARAMRTPVYDANKSLTRYLLFLASHDAVADTEEPGMIAKGRDGVAPILTVDHWKDTDCLTIEHIAPQRNPGTWEAKLYDDPETIDTLGNLTLLPPDENGVLANKPWDQKRAIYGILAAKTETEFDQRKAAAAVIGLNFSQRADEILKNSKYLAMCESISLRQEDWTQEFVSQRSERIAQIAWDRLAPWLGVGMVE